MKFFNNKERTLSVEITPLIDIVFLLVIFFVVTSKIETNQYLSLDLPKTESFASSLINTDRNIILLDTGTLVVNNRNLISRKLRKLLLVLKLVLIPQKQLFYPLKIRLFTSGLLF